MQVSLLWDKHKGEEIYIVGTGPSMRVFPVEILKGKTTIGLNQSWKYCSMSYSVTMHPELIVDYERDKSRKNTTQWIVKGQKPPLRVTFEDPRYYVFEGEKPVPTHGFNLKYVRERIRSVLYIGRGIQQTAMNIAAHMGARVIYLVGVDMCSLDGSHHGHDQSIQFHGLKPDDVYKEYRTFTAHVREVIRDELKIPVVSLTPFIGVGNPEEDFSRLKKEFRMKPLPGVVDISRYDRRKTNKDPNRRG